jgi:hypothetical protein
MAIGDSFKDVVQEGASINQLANLMHMDTKTVLRRLQGLARCGTRGTINLYPFRQAISKLVDLQDEEIEARLRKMNPKDLPPFLHKEFWGALLARQKYEEIAGEVWRTAAVSELVTRMCSTLRMSILLLPDKIAREARLADDQRAVLERECDEALSQMRDAALAAFQAPLEEAETLHDEGLRLSFKEEDELDGWLT